MAVSNRDRVGRAFELLAEGLGPYVDRRMRAKSANRDRWFSEFASRERGPVSMRDPAVQLKVLADCWDLAFRDELSRADRNVVFELRDVRNRWAHNHSFTADDAYRALDSMERLLTAIDAGEAVEVGKSKDDLMRLKYEAQAKKATPSREVLLTEPAAGLKPWREVIVPHDDVARGKFALAEFAADLYQVQQGKGAAEYVDAVEFFRRTYLTEGLRTLLAGAVERLAGQGGIPVVDLQTTFGGGKTHSQIATWHLFSGVALEALPQEVQDVVRAVGVGQLPRVHRAAIVGTKLSPGQPVVHDGVEVRTLWGELAWQLGGADAYALVAEADATATNPGNHLHRLLEAYSPALILIDEWVAYARDFLGKDGLPGGTFDTQFSFAQTLTEAARATPGVLLVVSLPASDVIRDDGHGVGSDLEVGGAGGREALRRLRNVIGRMESSWRPATAEESFEIVRRRLFKPVEADRLPDRDATARVFGELYRRDASEFPSECREAAYIDRIKAAYPIHPELFARLYEDWSTLDRFQRTRGVLRLMAGVIHALWEGGDQSPLILPASVPLAEAAVAAELTRNLDDAWKPIIDADIDGFGSLPAELDREVPNLGRYQAARRVARTVFLGSAPTWRSANRGIEASRVRLGCVVPGETIATFGDALNRLSGRATFLYTDGGRYWYGVQPSVARVARDRAERLLNEANDEVHAEINRRLQALQRDAGEFRGVHPVPRASADVPDEPRTRLVVLGPDQPHIARSDTSTALDAAREVLERRGTTPREYRNTLLFLAPDSRRLEDLERGVADYLAWVSVDAEAGADGLNLDPNQARQAATKKAESDRTVALRLADAYIWLLVPTQPEPTGPIAWETIKVDGQAGLALRASNKAVNDAVLYTTYPAALLRQRLDGELAALWSDGHASAGSVADAFARYAYLPRVADNDVIYATVGNGPATVAWQTETFATADGYDEQTGRYLGLTVGGGSRATAQTLIVRPDRAAEQLLRDQAEADQLRVSGDERSEVGAPAEASESERHRGEVAAAARRFHGSVRLDPERLNRDFGKVAQEVIQHLTAYLGTEVNIAVEISATNGDGFPDKLVRDVSENARTLKFDDFGFEER